MKALKIIGAILLLLVVIGFSLLLSLPDTARMEREVVIDAAPHEVFEQLISCRNYKYWWPWTLEADRVKFTCEGPVLGVGSLFRWNSSDPDIGTGHAEITRVHTDSVVVFKMEFEGYRGDPVAAFVLTPADGATKVTWIYREMHITGLSKIFVLGIDGFLGGYFETGLEHLKSRIEAAPYFANPIEPKLMPSFSYVGKEDFALNDPVIIEAKMAQDYGELITFLQMNQIEQSGQPIAFIKDQNQEEVSFVCGLPVDQMPMLDPEGPFHWYQQDSALVLRSSFSAMETDREEVYGELEQYADFYNYEPSGRAWEEYSDEDAEMLTTIYFPVE